MFETKQQPLITNHQFLRRMISSAATVTGFIILSLFAGVCGYHYIEGMPWIDALLNAAMIASGMGPVDTLHTVAGKLFASLYAIYSGLFLIAATGFLLAPLFHRVLHSLTQTKLD